MTDKNETPELFTYEKALEKAKNEGGILPSGPSGADGKIANLLSNPSNLKDAWYFSVEDVTNESETPKTYTYEEAKKKGNLPPPPV